jgi:hypothetical protein
MVKYVGNDFDRGFDVKGFLFALLVVTGLASAPVTDAAAASDAEYLELVNKAIAGEEPVDYTRIRQLYTGTSFYDPYGGDQAIKYMLQRAGQQIIYDKSPEATQEYNTLLAQHFAHFRSHMQAMEMMDKGHIPASQRALHQRALAGIVASIIGSGDGKSTQTAFKVIDPAEESLILKTYYHYQPSSQEFQQKDGHFWDVLKYQNPANDDAGAMYFNVDQILTAPRH